MKKLWAILFMLLPCHLAACDEWYTCDTGEMRCLGDDAQLCNADQEWVNWLDCGSEGMTCYTDRSHCGGSADIACCD